MTNKMRLGCTAKTPLGVPTTDTGPTSARPTSQRNTQQRQAVLAAFTQEDRPLAPAEILDLSSRAVPGISLTTVYRIIKKMLAEKEIIAVGLPNQPARYEAAGKAHHHHFLCVDCDRTYELGACSASYKNLAPKGFLVHDHYLFLEGRCRQCQ